MMACRLRSRPSMTTKVSTMSSAHASNSDAMSMLIGFLGPMSPKVPLRDSASVAPVSASTS